jgi:glycerol-3-phosphate dehydrogenase (NAD(P)+)
MTVETSLPELHNSPVLVLGAGSWGATLAHLLAGKGITTRLWSPFQAEVDHLNQHHTLPGKLEHFTLSTQVQISSDLDHLLQDAATLVFAVPSRNVRETARLVHQGLGGSSQPLCAISVAKGYEFTTLKPMTTLLAEELGVPFPVALSGPSHAEEVCQGLPTAVVAASHHHTMAEAVQHLFMTPRFRVYTSEDLIGVELGGALKNLVAIAAGAAIGLGFGDNTMAALVTRGLAEMTRLGVAMGANPQTFAGLSGLGDLVVTCASRHSRNRRLGLALAKGLTLDQALLEIGMVVEGVEMARSVQSLIARYQVEMPIAVQVAETLFAGVPVRDAVHALMIRDPKPEVR